MSYKGRLSCQNWTQREQQAQCADLINKSDHKNQHWMPFQHGSNDVFPAEDSISRLGFMSFLEKNQKLAQVWTTREFCCGSQSTCTLWCVYPRKWLSLWLLSSDPSSFPKQKLTCQGVVSIQVLFWEAAGMWPRCPPENKDCKCHHEECYSDKLCVLPTQPLGSVCRIVPLKLSESAVPDCLSSPLPLAMTSAASWIKTDLRGKDRFLTVGDRHLLQPNPYWRGDQEPPFSNSAGKSSIISQDPSFVTTPQEKLCFPNLGNGDCF